MITHFCVLQDSTQIIIQYHNLVCLGPQYFIWLVVIYGYLFLTQAVAVILAFRTRKVKIKALNDSKYLTIIIYLSTVIITVMIICVPALDNFLDIDAAVFGALIMLFATVVLGLTFIPKVSKFIVIKNQQSSLIA